MTKKRKKTKGIEMNGTYLLGCPLEASNDGVLDLVEVLDTLCAVHQNVGAVGVGTEAPDLPKNKFYIIRGSYKHGSGSATLPNEIIEMFPAILRTRTRE